jgi:hypothetical protein
MRTLALALLHHPVLDRQDKVVTTAITNLDLHDIARSSRTYGLAQYFVVHPIAAQRELAHRVRDHWVDGSGATRIPDRKPAMELLNIVEDLDGACGALEARGEGKPVLWATSARPSEDGSGLAHGEARELLAGEGPPVLLLLGTGWGLAPEVVERAEAMLEPIVGGADGYNHLSVRAAAAILLDRLVGAVR